MKKLTDKIIALDFQKPVKRLVILALIVVLVGGMLSARMLRTQIGELAALDRIETQSVQSAETAAQEGEHDGEHDGGAGEADQFGAGLISRPSTPALIVFFGWIALSGLCFIAYWLLVAAWLYKESSRAGMNSALWTILGLAANLPAVAVFLIVRGCLSRCPGCGTWQKHSVYCRVCGTAMESKCPKCQKDCSGTDAFCPNCGAVLNSAETAEK